MLSGASPSRKPVKPIKQSIKRLALAAFVAMALGGAFFSFDYAAFGRYDYVSDVKVVDPVLRAQVLVAEGRLKDAQDWIELYESLPGASWFGHDEEERAKLDAILADVKAKRDSLAYQAQELSKGFFLGDSTEDYGQAAEAVSSLFVIGDLRDLATAGIHWAEGEEVDYFVAALSAAGLALTLASFGPQAPAAETAKAGFAALKVAKRAGKVPPALEKEVLQLAKSTVKGEARLSKAIEPLSDLASFSKQHGISGALEVVARSEKLSDIPRVAKAADQFGAEAAAVLRFGGKRVVPAVEKHGAHEVKAVLKYGEDAVGKLAEVERVSAKTLLRDMRRFALFSGKALWRGVRGGVWAAAWFASALGVLLSVALTLKGILYFLIRCVVGVCSLFRRGKAS